MGGQRILGLWQRRGHSQPVDRGGRRPQEPRDRLTQRCLGMWGGCHLSPEIIKLSKGLRPPIHAGFPCGPTGSHRAGTSVGGSPKRTIRGSRLSDTSISDFFTGYQYSIVIGGESGERSRELGLTKYEP
jgi:hypothetical protein